MSHLSSPLYIFPLPHISVQLTTPWKLPLSSSPSSVCLAFVLNFVLFPLDTLYVDGTEVMPLSWLSSLGLDLDYQLLRQVFLLLYIKLLAFLQTWYQIHFSRHKLCMSKGESLIHVFNNEADSCFIEMAGCNFLYWSPSVL